MDDNKVIILNKIFSGGWLNKEGNIGHEIIDFLQTDDGNHYAYNNPWGVCPDDIYIGKKPTAKKKMYEAKYLALTGSGKNQEDKKIKQFEILYVIELEEKIHSYHTQVNKGREFRNIQKEIKKIIDTEKIIYNSKPLYEIYDEEDSLYLTFKCKKIYKAEKPILVQPSSYNFQRNKGYIKNDEFTADYNLVINRIDAAIKNGELKVFTPKKVHKNQIDVSKANKTFLDLINLTEHEQAYTDMLYQILSLPNMMNRFCEKFCQRKLVSNESFEVFRETKVVDGRMDVCAKNNVQNVVIENKVNSGLNGIKKDNTNQLNTYYAWAKEKGKAEPICFITAPNFREKEIYSEIYDDMKTIYEFVSYGDIAEFIEENKNEIIKSFYYRDLLGDIINAFKNLSYNTKEDYYAGMFYVATIK